VQIASAAAEGYRRALDWFRCREQLARGV